MMLAKPPFDEVVRKHGRTVLRVCRAVLGPIDADDAWSDTFLAALRAWPDLPGDVNLQAWLVTVAHRKAIDSARARQRRAVPVERLPDTYAVEGLPGASSPAGVSVDDDLRHAVVGLPDRQRQAVTYHYLADLPYADVAKVMGGSPEAARRAAADGIKALRGRLVADTMTTPSERSLE